MRESVGSSLSRTGMAMSPAAVVGWRKMAVQDFRREHGRRKHRIGFGEGDHPPDLVLKLADVAGPPMDQEVLHRFLGEPHEAFAELERGRGRRSG